MVQRAWGVAVMAAFWACGGEKSPPHGGAAGSSGASTTAEAGGSSGASATGVAGQKASLAGSGAVAGGGAPTATDGGAPTATDGGADATSGSSNAGQGAGDDAGAPSTPPCRADTCQNGGECASNPGRTCNCPTAFTGTLCQLPRFELIPLPSTATLGVAAGLSADGSVAVGTTGSTGAQAGFRWTHEAGALLLDALPGQSGSTVKGVSADGLVVVGSSGSPSAEAVYWPAGKATPQKLIDTGWQSSLATHVSANGSVIAGFGVLTSGDVSPFRWTKAGGAVALGTLKATSVSLRGMSDDGSVIVGNATVNATNQSFIWRATDPLSLNMLPALDGDDLTLVLGLSPDGSTAIGDSLKTGAHRVRWKNSGKPVLLNPLDPVATSSSCGVGPINTCTSMSSDGSVIYTQQGGIAQRWTAAKGLEALPGLASKGNCVALSPRLPRYDWIPGVCVGPPVAVVWDDHGQATPLETLLATFGVTATELTGVRTEVLAVSDSGDTILGDHLNFQPLVWVARILP